MKGIVLILLVVVAVSNAKLLPKKCTSKEDCEKGECCINYVFTPLFGGRCGKLRKEGESCTPLVKENEDNPEMYHFQCPCEGSLRCDATHKVKIFDHIIKHWPICVVPGDETTATEPDTTPFPEPTPA